MAGSFRIPFARGGSPPDELPPQGNGEVPPRPLAPGPGRVPPERERRELAARRELELRDVGGLAVEMARRDDWRYPLLHARCAEVLALERRIHEFDAAIAASQMAARGVGVVACACGAPIVYGSHFCANCGRPAPEVPPVVACSHCGQPLPADSNFCPVCGNAVAAEAFGGGPVDDTFVGTAPNREGTTGGP